MIKTIQLVIAETDEYKYVMECSTVSYCTLTYYQWNNNQWQEVSSMPVPKTVLEQYYEATLITDKWLK